MAGNGSDELLNVIIRSFASEGDKIAYPHPTYGYYKPLIDIQGAEAVPVEFGEDFALPEGLAVPGARITFLANPNAPLGHPSCPTLRSPRSVRGSKACWSWMKPMSIFRRGGCIQLIAEHPNAIVVRTMSKSFSLAGMRIGFAFAPVALIEGMWKVKDHYNLNRLSLVAAEAALEDIRRDAWQCRPRLRDALAPVC